MLLPEAVAVTMYLGGVRGMSSIIIEDRVAAVAVTEHSVGMVENGGVIILVGKDRNIIIMGVGVAPVVVPTTIVVVVVITTIEERRVLAEPAAAAAAVTDHAITVVLGLVIWTVVIRDDDALDVDTAVGRICCPLR